MTTATDAVGRPVAARPELGYSARMSLPRLLSPALLLPLLLTTLAVGCAQKPGDEGSSKPSKSSSSSSSSAAKTSAKDSGDDEEGGGETTRVDPTDAYKPTPRQPELKLDEAQLTALLAAARAGCNGDKQPAALAGLPTTQHPVIAVLYGENGRRDRKARVEGEADLTTTAFRAGEKVCKSGDRKSLLHLLVVTQSANLLNFGVKGLFDNKVFEPQVTGAIYRFEGKTFELDPLEQVEKNMGPNDARNALAKGVSLDPGQMPNRIDLTIEVYRAAHVGERFPDKKPTRFFRGHKHFTHEDLTHDVLEERLKLIGEWYRHNVIDGEVTYQYLPSRRTYTNNERTMIRSTMSTWVLNRLAVYLKDKELQDKGDELIRFYLDRYFNIEASKKAGAIQPSTKPLANGNTVENRWTVASFIAAAANERTDKDKYKTEMDLLMKWAASHQRNDGVIWTPNGGEQYFMPGQFLLPVTYFYRDTKDTFYKDIFDKAFAVYEPNLYETMDFGPEWHTPYAPAWFTQPFTQMYLLTGEKKYADIIFAINDRVALAYDTNARHQVYFDYDGMLAPKPGSMGNNSVTAASLEALTDAAITAKKAGDTVRYKRYQEIIKRSTAFLLRLQWIPENTWYIQDREKVIGGFKNDMINSRMWMDSVWHLTSAFIKIQQHRLLDP